MFPAPASSNSVGLEVVVPDKGVVLPEATTDIPLNWRLRLPPLVALGF